MWTRRNRRVTLRWTLVILTMLGFAVACGPQPQPRADDSQEQQLEGVKIQKFNIKVGYCVVATHDTMQGASVAMWCTN